MKHVASIALASALLLAACTASPTERASHRVDDELISYKIDDTVTMSKTAIDFPYDKESFEKFTGECKNDVNSARMDKIEATLVGTKGVAYTFAYDGESQDDRDFVVSVFPNALPYTAIKEFQNDFGPCGAGGDYYPHALSAKSILFVNSCGTGYDDGSGKAHGCDEAKKVVEQSIVAL